MINDLFQCPYCTHNWHGLTCAKPVHYTDKYHSLNDIGSKCKCPSSIGEFRGDVQPVSQDETS